MWVKLPRERERENILLGGGHSGEVKNADA